MAEIAWLALPAEWPQLEFALGEHVFIGRRGVAHEHARHHGAIVRGIFLDYDEDEHPVWLYDAGGFRNLACDLAREPWPDVPLDKGIDPTCDDALDSLP